VSWHPWIPPATLGPAWRSNLTRPGRPGRRLGEHAPGMNPLRLPSFRDFPGWVWKPRPAYRRTRRRGAVRQIWFPDPASAWCRPRLPGPSPSRGQSARRPAGESGAPTCYLARWRRGRRVGGLALDPSLAGLSGDRPLDDPPRALQEDVGRARPRAPGGAHEPLEWRSLSPWTQAVGHRCGTDRSARRAGGPGSARRTASTWV
jgi:hypothetical protein